MSGYGKKIRYGSLAHLFLLGKTLIVSLVLTSSQMFREDYERSKKKCKVVLWNFLLWHNETCHKGKGVMGRCVHVCLKVWGGLNITFPKEAMEILLCKWVLYVLEPKESNLNILFKYMLEWNMLFLVYFIKNVSILVGYKV